MKDEKDFYIEALQAKLAEVHKTLAPLVDDDNRPVEALARYAVERLAEAETTIAAQDKMLAEWESHKLDARLAEAEALLRRAGDALDYAEMKLDEFVASGQYTSGIPLIADIDAFLTAASTPAPCPHDSCTQQLNGETITITCTKCGWHVTGFIGQPWGKPQPPSEKTCPACGVTNGHSMFCPTQTPHGSTAEGT